MSFNEKEAAAEAVLFASGDPVKLQVIASALEVDTSEARGILDGLKEAYETENRGIRLLELDGSYQLATANEYYDYLKRATMSIQKPRLTDVMLETLSIVAYKQPVTRLEIENIRGVKSDHAVNRLVEYGLIKELGRLDAPGRPVLFGTTEEFLRFFGLKSPDELPVPESDLMDRINEEINRIVVET